MNSIPPMNVKIPKKTKDITQIIKEVYNKIRSFFIINKQKTLTFSQLLPSKTKQDKIYTFIPLLHLTTQRKVDLRQQQHFGEIEIMLNAKKDVDKELGAEA
jgi:chromatin segregation and condensation protein Rec8/ScpA/Scc1 (kleisin family)